MAKNKLYWTTETNEAVDDFVGNKNLNKRQLDRLYTKKLYPALDNMIRAIIHKYSLYQTGMQVDELTTVGHGLVYENLVKSREHENKYYNPEMSSSFHYYTTVIKNSLVRLQQEHQKKENETVDLDVDLIPLEEEDTTNHGEILLNVSLDWLEANYEDVFTHWIDKDITKSFLECVRTEQFDIESLMGLSQIVFKYSDLEEHVFYSRYYETRTVHNEVYKALRRKYDNGEPISAETEIQLHSVY